MIRRFLARRHAERLEQQARVWETADTSCPLPGAAERAAWLRAYAAMLRKIR